MRPVLQKIATLQGHKQGVYALAATASGDQFYTSGSDGQVAEWTLENPTEALGLARLSGSCWAMAVMPGTSQLVAAQNQEGLHFMDLETRAQIGSIALGKANIYALQPLNDHQIAVSDEAGWIKIIDTATLQIVRQKAISDKPIRALALLPSGLLAAAGSDGNVRLLNDELDAVHTWAAHAPTVMALCPLPDGGLVTGGRDARIRIWDLSGPAPALRQEVAAHHFSVYGLALHPGGELLLSASMDKTLKLWDVETMRLLRVHDSARYGGHTASVNRCMWLNGNYALSCSDDRTAILWEFGQS